MRYDRTAHLDTDFATAVTRVRDALTEQGADRTIGLLLPCNVVVRADGDRIAVQALDPQTMVALTGLDALRPVAEEATRRLDAVLASLTGSTTGEGR